MTSHGERSTDPATGRRTYNSNGTWFYDDLPEGQYEVVPGKGKPKGKLEQHLEKQPKLPPGISEADVQSGKVYWSAPLGGWVRGEDDKPVPDAAASEREESDAEIVEAAGAHAVAEYVALQERELARREEGKLSGLVEDAEHVSLEALELLLHDDMRRAYLVGDKPGVLESLKSLVETKRAERKSKSAEAFEALQFGKLDKPDLPAVRWALPDLWAGHNFITRRGLSPAGRASAYKGTGGRGQLMAEDRAVLAQIDLEIGWLEQQRNFRTLRLQHLETTEPPVIRWRKIPAAKWIRQTFPGGPPLKYARHVSSLWPPRSKKEWLALAEMLPDVRRFLELEEFVEGGNPNAPNMEPLYVAEEV
jgi:hypothetical protein